LPTTGAPEKQAGSLSCFDCIQSFRMAKMKASVLRWALLERQEEEEEKVNVEQIKLALP